MNVYHSRRSRRKAKLCPPAPLPLFDHAAEQEALAEETTRTLARRYNLPPAMARLVAELAGLSRGGKS